MTTRRFAVVERAADPGTLHAFEPPIEPTPTIVVAEVTAPALVLGSTQSAGDADPDRAARDGYDVVRRRSGGERFGFRTGASFGSTCGYRQGDRLWDDDVSRAAVPVGVACRSRIAWSWRRSLGP